MDAIRALVLISKVNHLNRFSLYLSCLHILQVVQAIGNQVEFVAGGKEDYMTPMNEFVKSSMPDMMSLIHNLMVVPPSLHSRLRHFFLRFACFFHFPPHVQMTEEEASLSPVSPTKSKRDSSKLGVLRKLSRTRTPSK